MPDADYQKTPCRIVIIGASGDLAQRKLLPALFSLYCNNTLPDDWEIVGLARTTLSDEQFRERAMTHLTCRYVPEDHRCQQLMDHFLARCHYLAGSYDSAETFAELAEVLRPDGVQPANLLFYMAIPPSIFIAAARSLADAGLLTHPGERPWSRVVIEKPFGHDTASAHELLAGMARLLPEEQTYRIDHYLGKEVIQNLMILRFANCIFEPIWDHSHIRDVRIRWSETLGVEGRAGYFDRYGIIRDVVQNHLLQILALIGMEQPIRLDAEDIRDEKVKLLRSVAPIRLDEVTVGQYSRGTVGAQAHPGYREAPDVPDDSRTPTYARLVLRVNNPRWCGVPFTIEAGKAADLNTTEITIRFSDVPYSIFRGSEELVANSLVIRVQPDEEISLNIINKLPGLSFDLEPARLNLHYRSAFSRIVPDAYERLLLDVMRGDRSLFLRDDELLAAWQIITPVLDALDQQGTEPTPYPFGTFGPPGDKANHDVAAYGKGCRS